MKHLIYISLIIASVIGTYQFMLYKTIDATNLALVKSALFDHKTRTQLFEIIESHDKEYALKFVSMLQNNDLRKLEGLLDSLEKSELRTLVYMDKTYEEAKEYLEKFKD